ncbi:MAG: DoxX family protein [Chloroflexota bacterium]|nr:DoxX family protein [Lentimicrobium sp.]
MKNILFYTGKHSTKTNFVLFVMRVVAGSFIITHGWGKALKVIEGPPYDFADPIGLGVPLSLFLAAFAEFLCAVLIIMGLTTRLAAIPLIVTMAVAAFVSHAGEAFFAKELPLLYLAVFFTIAVLGAGKYSLDYLIRRKKR